MPAPLVSDLQTALTVKTPEAWVYGRTSTETTNLVVAPSSGTEGLVKQMEYVYGTGTSAHVVTKASQKDRLTPASGSQDLAFDHQPAGYFKVERLKGVTLSVTGSTDSAGATYDYDPTGLWMTKISQNGVAWNSQEPSHDGLGHPLSQQDPNGLQTTYAWDNLGRLTNINPPSPEAGTTLTPTLRSLNYARASQNATYYYNGFWDLMAEERPGPMGLSHKPYGYDAGGRKAFESTWRSGSADLKAWTGAAPANSTQWAYDGRGRVTSITDPNGIVTTKTYADTSDTSTVESTTGNSKTTLKTDVLGHLASVTDAAGQTTSYVYGPTGKLVKVTQGNQVRTWTYDGFDRLTQLVQPESGTTSYSSFTLFGKPQTTVYGYGSPSPKTLSTTYDAIGRVTAVSSDDQSVSQSFKYDETGHGYANDRLTTSSDKAVQLSHAYGGLNGRLSALTTSIWPSGSVNVGSSDDYSQTFDYDALGSRTKASVDGREYATAYWDTTGLPGTLSKDGTTLISAAYYDEGWGLKTLNFSPLGLTSTFTYDKDQARLASLGHTRGTTTLKAWTYTYPTSGDQTGMLTGDGEDSYGYDLLGRLTSATVLRLDGTTSLTQTFKYDAHGNQIESTTAAIPADLSKVLANFTFNATDAALDLRNQLPGTLAGGTTTGASYDAQGNLTSIYKTPGSAAQQLQFGYDALGRVVQMDDADRGVTEKYYYTPDGLRTRIETYQGGSLVKVQYKLYNDARQVVSEYEIVLK